MTHSSERRAPVCRKRGFSLLELIVVLVILGLLTSLIGPRVYKWVARGNTQAAKMQIQLLRQGLVELRLDVGRFPTSTEGLRALIESNGSQRWGGPYLESRVLPKDPWGREYQYACPGQYGDYDIWSYGADGASGGQGEDADVTSWGE